MPPVAPPHHRQSFTPQDIFTWPLAIADPGGERAVTHQQLPCACCVVPARCPSFLTAKELPIPIHADSAGKSSAMTVQGLHQYCKKRGLFETMPLELAGKKGHLRRVFADLGSYAYKLRAAGLSPVGQVKVGSDHSMVVLARVPAGLR